MFICFIGLIKLKKHELGRVVDNEDDVELRWRREENIK